MGGVLPLSSFKQCSPMCSKSRVGPQPTLHGQGSCVRADLQPAEQKGGFSWSEKFSVQKMTKEVKS